MPLPPCYGSEALAENKPLRMLTHPPPCPTDPAGQPSRAEPSQGPLPQPLKAWPLGSSQGTVGASGLPWKAAHRLQGAGHVPDAHSLGCGLSPPFLQSERAPAPCACVAPSSAPAWLVHSPLMDLHQESRQGGARRSHVCTSPLPGGRILAELCPAGPQVKGRKTGVGLMDKWAEAGTGV